MDLQDPFIHGEFQCMMSFLLLCDKITSFSAAILTPCISAVSAVGI
jgi:hypothetical protein